MEIPSASHYTYNIFRVTPFPIESRDTVVGIATGYGLDDQGVGVPVPVGS
jgi:hypothetical protein